MKGGPYCLTVAHDLLSVAQCRLQQSDCPLKPFVPMMAELTLQLRLVTLPSLATGGGMMTSDSG
jgi:hypothetical protein